MAIKKWLIDGYILECAHFLAGFVREDSVDQQKGVTVREVFQHFVDVHAVQGSFPSISASRFSNCFTVFAS